ncbi:MAG: cytochrome c [Spongiibacteraceae bacterium]|nr:cytochrome c [Spongiibacteraceae bacterium]
MTITKSAAALVLLSVVAATTYAQEGVINHRKGVMEALGGHFGASLAIVKGESQFAGDRAFHADSIARLAKIAVDSYPEGSGTGKTKAKPEIWTQPAKFDEAMQTFVDAAQALAAAGDDNKAYMASFKSLGESCKGCHDAFKEE